MSAPVKTSLQHDFHGYLGSILHPVSRARYSQPETHSPGEQSEKCITHHQKTAKYHVRLDK